MSKSPKRNILASWNMSVITTSDSLNKRDSDGFVRSPITSPYNISGARCFVGNSSHFKVNGHVEESTVKIALCGNENPFPQKDIR